MAIKWFIVGFVEKYGMVNGLILSEICRLSGKESDGGISMKDLSEDIGYLTTNQIRNGLEKLRRNGCLEVKRKRGEFTRELIFSPTSESMRNFLDEYSVSINQLVLK